VLIDQTRRPLTMVSAIWKLYAYCKQQRPQLIHAHMTTSCIIAWPVTRALRIPLFTTVHNAFQKRALLMGLGDRVIAVSRAVKASMSRSGISDRRLRVVLNGTIDSARFPLPLPTPVPLDHPAIVFVGGLHPRKGISDLINAFKQVSETHPEARLYLVGDGPTRKEYEDLVASLGLSARVLFFGAVSDPRCYLQSADIFVLASHADPAPLVLSEAREFGCAIIATDVGGIPEMLDEGRAGILVPPQQPHRIAEAINRLLENPEDMRLYRDRSAMNLENLSVARVAKDTIKVYEECVHS
jgi:glycosyltransferase involved in cell wall biosynthesis